MTKNKKFNKTKYPNTYMTISSNTPSWEPISSSGSTSGTYNLYSTSIISGNSWTQHYEDARNEIDLDNTDFKFTIKDGTQHSLTANEYFEFIAYNHMSPKDCKDTRELKHKMMAIRL